VPSSMSSRPTGCYLRVLATNTRGFLPIAELQAAADRALALLAPRLLSLGVRRHGQATRGEIR